MIRRVEATDNLERYVSMFALHETEKGALGRADAVFCPGADRAAERGLHGADGISCGDVVALFDGAVQREYRVGGSFKSRATDVEAVISSSFAAEDFGADAYQFLGLHRRRSRGGHGADSGSVRRDSELEPDRGGILQRRAVHGGAFLRPMHSMIYFILLMAGVG